MDSNLIIIDNFLPETEFLKIKNSMLGGGFPWSYEPTVVTANDNLTINKNNFQFTHTLYFDEKPTSKFFALTIPILKKLKCANVFRVKANLITRTEKRIYHGYHVDIGSRCENIKTAIYYVNTNDGVTSFKDGTIVESIENRIVIFDNHLEHTGSSCTDENIRCVINLNYTSM